MSLVSTGSSYSFHQSGRSSASAGVASTKGLDPCHEAGTTYSGGVYVGAKSTAGNQLQAGRVSASNRKLAHSAAARPACNTSALDDTRSPVIWTCLSWSMVPLAEF